MKYLSLFGECETLKIIEKSKFLTTTRHVESEKEARDFIAGISKKYADATHNCYAYICDITGNFMRFSDDNEPQGTAGMPMLEVLKNNSLVQTAAVVTRWFGGIKLGAGGLLRAYSSCLAENIAAAQKVRYETCAEYLIRVDYSLAETLTRFLAEYGADTLGTEYSDGVTVRAAVRAEVQENFAAELVNRLNGRLKMCKVREYFFPFKV